jgi:hypothetical protein
VDAAQQARRGWAASRQRGSARSLQRHQVVGEAVPRGDEVIGPGHLQQGSSEVGQLSPGQRPASANAVKRPCSRGWHTCRPVPRPPARLSAARRQLAARTTAPLWSNVALPSCPPSSREPSSREGTGPHEPSQPTSPCSAQQKCSRRRRLAAASSRSSTRSTRRTAVKSASRVGPSSASQVPCSTYSSSRPLSVCMLSRWCTWLGGGGGAARLPGATRGCCAAERCEAPACGQAAGAGGVDGVCSCCGRAAGLGRSCRASHACRNRCASSSSSSRISRSSSSTPSSPANPATAAPLSPAPSHPAPLADSPRAAPPPVAPAASAAASSASKSGISSSPAASAAAAAVSAACKSAAARCSAASNSAVLRGAAGAAGAGAAAVDCTEACERAAGGDAGLALGGSVRRTDARDWLPCCEASFLGVLST